MKRFALGLAAAILAATAAYAAPAGTGDSSLGKVWTDDKGMTLYTFDKDASGKSNCNGDCAAKWPPFKAAADAKDDGEWTVVTRDDGSKMWAYEGKPLYTWVKDGVPGDVTGDGVGGVWHAAKAD
jgi:predicted lipoprotein with Yx(FWY)xxD motif